jgi:hypothetical protein
MQIDGAIMVPYYQRVGGMGGLTMIFLGYEPNGTKNAVEKTNRCSLGICYETSNSREGEKKLTGFFYTIVPSDSVKSDRSWFRKEYVPEISVVESKPNSMKIEVHHDRVVKKEVLVRNSVEIEKKEIEWGLFEEIISMAVEDYMKRRVPFIYPTSRSASVKGKYAKRFITDLLRPICEEKFQSPKQENLDMMVLEGLEESLVQSSERVSIKKNRV